jgi:AraC-like DNA-binding protein
MGKSATDCKTYGFSRRKYGGELLIDLVRLESLAKYNRQTPRHCLSFYDITLIRDGLGQFALEETDFPVEPNQLYFTAPAQVREWKVPEIPRGLVLIFEEEFLCSFFSDPLFVKKLSFFRNKLAPPQLKLNDGQGQYFTNLLLQIEQEIVSNKETHLLRALLYQSLAWLNNTYRSAYQLTEKPQNPRVTRFLQLVETHYCTEHATSFYAAELCITAGYLNELVKDETGVSAKQYLINRLITEARRLLQFKEVPVAEIAWELGFSDPSYFVRLFHNETGISPLAFRKNKLS